MKELDSYQSNNSPKKQRERSKKQKSTYKLFTKDCWPKVMISRDSIVYKKIKDSSGSPSLSFIEESSSDSRGKEEKNNCEHLYCENGTNFEEEQDVCLISSSSEIQKSFELRDILRKIRKNSDGLIDESEFDCLSEDKYDQQGPIFVDLTTDEKNTWKQTILKQFCDVKTITVNEMENRNEKCSTDVVLGTKLVISIKLKNLLIDQLFD